MKIVVCVKHIPNPELPMQVDPVSKRLVREPAESVLDEADEYGIEAALQLAEERGGEVIAVTMGPDFADDALRRAMAMGVNDAIHITDSAMAGSDALGTARVLAAIIKDLEADLIFCATESTDAYSGMVPGALAELLGLPQVTFARSISVEGSTVTIQRDTEFGYQVIQSPMPALISATASISEPRYPTFRGLMQAKRKPVDIRDLASTGLDASTVGEAGAKERVLQVDTIQQEKAGVKIVDEDGDSIEQIVGYLKQIEVI